MNSVCSSEWATWKRAWPWLSCLSGLVVGIFWAACVEETFLHPSVHGIMCTVELRDQVGLSEGAVLWESLSKAFKDSSLGEQAPFDP